MGFVPRGSGATVTLGVVAYGVTERLAACLDSLLAHASDTDFDVVCVINPTGTGEEDASLLPDGVEVILPDLNLGWAGGLHAVRHATTAEWLGWIQDDSVLLPGWLDAQVAAAADHPRGAAFGVVGLDATGTPSGHSGGVAGPSPDPALWNDSDPTPQGVWPAGVEERDWVTSKGLFVRLAAWDEVGGPCARQYPLNHVDKEFGTHLRAHGWSLYVVPGANVSHLEAQSAPSVFRLFLREWQTDVFAARWERVVERLAEAAGGPVDHECHGHPTMEDVMRECAHEATRMLVPFARFASRWGHELEGARAAVAEDLAQSRLTVAHLQGSASWRFTAPLRTIVGAARRLTRRA